MSIENNAKEQFEAQAIQWMSERHSKFFNWTLGDVSVVKCVTYNKKEGHPEAPPDGLVVPILCATCGHTMAHYSESAQ